MAKSPPQVRFKKATAVFDSIARARLCESQHSVMDDSAADPILSDLIESFIERDRDEDERDDYFSNNGSNANSNNQSSDFSSTMKKLQNLLGCREAKEDRIKETLRNETKLACLSIGTSSSSSEGFKRCLMNRLRERGFDAGLCKMGWEKSGRVPAGFYEYVDVTVAGNRYVIEVFLAGEFRIARPSERYEALVVVFSEVFVGREDELKGVVRLMCAAGVESMKSRDMHVPPWRHHVYMHAKWFGPYKRTTYRR